MLSKADMAQGHGVLSAHDEQVALVREVMGEDWDILENSKKHGDITHYHTINPEFFLGLPFAKRKGKTVGYVHFLPETVENSIHLPRFCKQIFYWYMLKFYKHMDYLVTVNPYFIERLKHYGVPEEKVSYIPNFVSEEQFYPLGGEQKRETRREYGLSEEKFTVLCAGQLQKRKGIFEFAEIARQMPDIQFVWAGDFSFGRISDGYEEIQELMKDTPDNLKFLGLVERSKMNAVYNMADVMFLPSYEELFPMTILESMNCRVPVLVRELEIYEPILFDYALYGKSNEEFIHILTRLKKDKAYYNRAAEKSFEGHENYSRKKIGQMWKDYYTQILYSEEKEWKQKVEM